MRRDKSGPRFCRGAVRLFVYGTLRDPLVRRLVCGRRDRRPSWPAWLGHWRRGTIIGRHYPGIVRRGGGRVHGRLLRVVDPATLARLDAYETSEYWRVGVRVWTAQGWRRCQVYAARADIRVTGGWDLAGWRLSHRRAWITRLRD